MDAGSEAPRFWRAALAGMCATLLGIGLARFAYTPLLPALIGAGWFAPSEAAYLGAASLAGYLGGAASAARLARRWPAPVVLRAAMLAASLCFLACAWPLGFGWFFVWRFLAGFTGAVLMVLAAPTALRPTPAGRRGRVSGIVFTGIGVGIVLSGLLVPALAPWGLTPTWLGLAAVGALLTALAWPCWPEAPAAPARSDPPTEPVRAAAPVLLLLAAYAGDGLGFVPHTLFWVDFIARGLGQGLKIGGIHWVVFGIGAAVGALAVGMVADRIGLAASLTLAFLVKGLAVALPLVASGTTALVVSGALVGALTPGTSALVSARVAELLGARQHARVWGWMTSAFAIAQALAAYGFAFLFDRTGSYRALFAIGAACLVLSAAAALVSARSAAPAPGGRERGTTALKEEDRHVAAPRAS